MKKTITSLLFVLSAFVITSFVLPSDKKRTIKQLKANADYIDFELESNASGSVRFEVIMVNQANNDHYYYWLDGTDIEYTIVEEGVYDISFQSIGGSGDYTMQTCLFSTRGQGGFIPSVPVGNGCDYIHLY